MGKQRLTLYFGLQNHCRWWLQPWNEKCLLLGRKAMTNLDSILKSRDITLPTKICLVKAMVFFRSRVWMWELEYKEGWDWKAYAFKLWCLRKLLSVPWTARRSSQSMLKEINPEYSLEGLMLKLNLPYFGHLMPRADLEKIQMLWRQKEKGMPEDEMVS